MTIGKNNQLLILTKSLIQYTDQLERAFNDQTIKPENTPLFFEYVREHTEDVFEQLGKWESLLMTYVNNNRPIIAETMIASTKDNMNALIMHSYYKDVRRRRYMEIKRSCIYVFQAVLKEIVNEDE